MDLDTDENDIVGREEFLMARLINSFAVISAPIGDKDLEDLGSKLGVGLS